MDGGVFIFFFIFIIVAIAISAARASSCRSNLENVAQRLGGRVTRGFFSDTDLEIRVDGVEAHVYYHAGSKNKSAYTRLRFLCAPPGRLRVVPEGIWASVTKAFGAEDISTGESSFDDAFLVQGTPLPWVREVLDRDVRGRLSGISQRAAGFLTSGSVRLEAGPGGITLWVQRNLVTEIEALERFIQDGIAIFRKIQGSASTGISVVSIQNLKQEGRCPVCEHPLEDRVKSCESCATPHHDDCWEYFGGCSTYACARRGGR